MLETLEKAKSRKFGGPQSPSSKPSSINISSPRSSNPEIESARKVFIEKSEKSSPDYRNPLLDRDPSTLTEEEKEIRKTLEYVEKAKQRKLLLQSQADTKISKGDSKTFNEKPAAKSVDPEIAVMERALEVQLQMKDIAKEEEERKLRVQRLLEEKQKNYHMKRQLKDQENFRNLLKKKKKKGKLKLKQINKIQF